MRLPTTKPRSALVTALVRAPYLLETQYRRRVPRWLFHPRYCLLFSLPAKQPLVNRAGDAEHTSFRWANEADLTELAQGMTEASLAKRRAEQHRAAVLIVEQQLVAVVWFAKNRYEDEETEVVMPLEPHQAWLYSAYVHRQHRDRGHYHRLISAAVNELRMEGITEILFTVDATNLISKVAHRSLGASRIGTLWGAHFCGSSWYKVSRFASR